MHFRKITAALATAAIAAGGVGVAQAQTDGNAPSAGAKQAHRGGPMSNAQLKKLATKLGVTTAQLKAAFDATRPAKGDRGDFAADIASALGVETSAVQEILDANRPPRPTERPGAGTRPPKPDQSKLIAALASGLSIDQDTVKSALDKLHSQHRDDHAAALAKELGLDADTVAAALKEAGPPAKGPGPRR